MLPFQFGTVGSPISTPVKPGGSIGAIIHSRTLGLEALELGWVHSVRVSEATCDAIRQTSLEHKVAISVHAPYYINLNATPEEWQKSRQRLMDAAYYGNLAGATDIIFHPGSYFNQPPESVLPIAIRRLQECVTELHDNGNRVILRPETMGKSAMLGSFEDCLTMSVQVNGVQPCLDFAHLHARTGNGTMNSYDEWMRVLEQYANVLGTASLTSLHIHLSGIAYSEKGEREHLPLRKSDFDLIGLFRALIQTNSAGRILCESPIMEEDAIYLRDTYCSML